MRDESHFTFAHTNGCYIRHKHGGQFISIHNTESPRYSIHPHGRLVEQTAPGIPYLTHNPEEATVFYIIPNDSGGFILESMRSQDSDEMNAPHVLVYGSDAISGGQKTCWLSDDFLGGRATDRYIWEITPPKQGCLHSIFQYQPSKLISTKWGLRNLRPNELTADANLNLINNQTQRRLWVLDKDFAIDYQTGFHRVGVVADLRINEKNAVWMFSNSDLQDEVFLRTFFLKACRFSSVDSSDWFAKPGGMPFKSIVAQYRILSSNRDQYLYDEFVSDIRQGLCFAMEFFSTIV